jgi:hypothetical protein
MKSARVVFRVARGVEVRVSQGICRLFGSCPLRCKTLVFPGFFAFLANCFGFPARPCTCMRAHAASSSALPWYLVSRPVNRQSRLATFVFPGKTVGFAAEVVGFEPPSRFRRTSKHTASFLPTLGRPCAVTVTSCLFP